MIISRLKKSPRPLDGSGLSCFGLENHTLNTINEISIIIVTQSQNWEKQKTHLKTTQKKSHSGWLKDKIISIENVWPDFYSFNSMVKKSFKTSDVITILHHLQTIRFIEHLASLSILMRVAFDFKRCF